MNIFASGPLWVIVLVVGSLATWGGGGQPAVAGYGLGVATAMVSLAGWYGVSWLLTKSARAVVSSDGAPVAEDAGNLSEDGVVRPEKGKGQIGTTIVVLAFLLKLPVAFLLIRLALQLDGPGPGCFAFGLLLVYSGAALWGVCRTPSEVSPDA